MSVKRTVTSFRSSAGGAGAGASSGAPHARQNFATSGFSCPQAEQTFMNFESYAPGEPSPSARAARPARRRRHRARAGRRSSGKWPCRHCATRTRAAQSRAETVIGLSGAMNTLSGQRTVLVVDDHAPLRTLCRLNLEPAGFRVVEAADGDEALAAVAADRPDAILLDIMMPRLSGWKVAAALLADETTDHIPIISRRS